MRKINDGLTNKKRAYLKNPEKYRANSRKHYYENAEKYRERMRKDSRKYFLVSRYGITEEEYNQLLVNQNFSCAICKSHINEFKRKLSVDHNHETGKVRGLLCNNCNAGIGYLEEDVDSLRQAIEYLEKI